MFFHPMEIPGVVVIEPKIFRDARGFFMETYHAEKFREAGIDLPFVQDNHSRSTRNILRGLHIQVPYAQGKLVRVIEGEIYDVAVDVRLGSPHFGKSVAVFLSAEKGNQLYIPPGFAHGFCVTSEIAQVQYKCTALYHPEAEFSIAWNDPELAIDWPIRDPILSDKDRNAPRLNAVHARLMPYTAK